MQQFVPSPSMQLGTGTFVVNAAAVDSFQGYTNECINYKIPPNNVVSGVLNVFQKNENKFLNTFSVTDHSVPVLKGLLFVHFPVLVLSETTIVPFVNAYELCFCRFFFLLFFFHKLLLLSNEYCSLFLQNKQTKMTP